MIRKNSENGLIKDSIVKCDDFIKLDNKEISFKIGSVTEIELMKFLDTYERYLSSSND